MSRPEQNSFQTLVTLEDNYLTSKNIDLLDAAISAHEDALHTLTRNLALLKNHRNSLSATWRLPIEVISRIMFVVTQLSIKEINESDVYPPPQRIPVPLILGQICSAWRCLARRLPELWATIPLAVSRSRYDTQIALLDDWLGRAGEIQDLSIILTLAHDDSELYHFQNCPPRAVLEKLYKRSHQWHTFYSTLPNLCFQDLFKGVYGNLGRLDTLVLNRSGRSPFQVGLGNVIHVNTGGLHSLGGQGTNVVVQAGPSVNGVFVNGVMVNGETHGGPPNGQGILPIHLPTTNTSSPSPPKIKSPWFMLSKTPSLKTVILPESLSPFDIPLPWVNLTYLELRTVSLSDCLHVLSCTPRMTSFTFHGIFSPSSINISFVNLSTTFSSSSSTTSGHGHLQCQRIQLNELRHFSVFSDHVNLSRFLNALVTPVLCAFGFKCTTGAIGGVLTEITKLGERSGWHELYDDDDRHHAGRLKKLEICVPSVGVAEETIVGWLMSPFDARSRIDVSSGDVSSGSGDDDAITARIQNMIEELVLESWQVDVAGLSDSFLIKMNPERRVRWIKPYSYPLDNLRPGPPVEQLTSSPSCSTSVLSTRPGIASDQAAIPVNVPTRRDEDEGDEGDDDEIRDVVEQVVQISLGGSVPLHEVLLPNLTAMTYRGALSFTPKVLKETIYARWNRKRRTRTRGVPKPMTINADHSGIGSGIQIVGKGKERMDTAAAAAAAAVEKEEKEKEEEEEEEEYFPTAELKAFDVRAPEMAVEDLKELIDEETKLAFREMLREGFCLSVETKKGLMAF